MRPLAHQTARTTAGRAGGLALALLAAAACSPSEQAAEAPAPSPSAGLPELEMTLAPGGLDTAPHIDVTLEISGLDVAAGEAFLQSPAVFAGVDAVPYGEDGVAGLTVTDAGGAVPLTRADDEPDPSNFLYWRHWQAGRDLSGPVTVSYRAPIDLVIPELGSGPPFDLRASEGVVSGAGNTFLVVPETPQPFRIAIAWDLGEMTDGSIGVSSFGRGEVVTPGPASRLVTAYYMAGPVGRYPAEGEGHGFSAYWVGDPPFDPQSVMPWAEEVYDAQIEFFGIEDPDPYVFFARGNPYPGGGGAGLINSFMLSYPEDTADLDGISVTIAHEMSHKWVGGVSGRPGATSWFSEGANVFYTRRVPLQAGLMTPEQYIADVNDHAVRYYTNAINDLPNEDIPGLFWSDTRVRTLPYDRGSMYFAGVHARVREASGGERGMDDLFFELDARRQAGETVTAETWADIVAAELGEEARERFEAMMAGALQIPPSSAFGPCFERVESESEVFELGFDAASLASPERIVSGLVDGSRAQAAGLRNGDHIVAPVALEAVQSDASRTLALAVQRGEETTTIEYRPRGETVTVYTWQRVDGIPDAQCPY
jgi:hypothetical protein